MRPDELLGGLSVTILLCLFSFVAGMHVGKFQGAEKTYMGEWTCEDVRGQVSCGPAYTGEIYTGEIYNGE